MIVITLQFASFKAKIQMEEVLFFLNRNEAPSLSDQPPKSPIWGTFKTNKPPIWGVGG